MKSHEETKYGGSTPFQMPAINMKPEKAFHVAPKNFKLGHGCWLAGRKPGQRLRVKSCAGMRTNNSGGLCNGNPC